MIRFACPQCQQAFRVENKAVGRKTKCPKCGTALIVPTPSPSLTAPIASPLADDIFALEDEASALPTSTGSSEYQANDLGPLPASVSMHSHTTAPHHEVARAKSSPLYLALGGCVVAGIAGLAVWFMTDSGFLLRLRDSAPKTRVDAESANTAKLKAEAELAQVQAAKAKAEAERARAEAEAARAKADVEAMASRKSQLSANQVGKDSENSEEHIVETLKRGLEAYRELVTHSKYMITEFSYDVQKSSSLLSPYVALVTYKSCTKKLQDNPYAWYEHRDTLGWRKGRWRATGRVMRSIAFDNPLRDVRSSDFLRVNANGESTGHYALEDLFALEDEAFSK